MLRVGLGLVLDVMLPIYGVCKICVFDIVHACMLVHNCKLVPFVCLCLGAW